MRMRLKSKCWMLVWENRGIRFPQFLLFFSLKNNVVIPKSNPFGIRIHNSDRTFRKLKPHNFTKTTFRSKSHTIQYYGMHKFCYLSLNHRCKWFKVILFSKIMAILLSRLSQIRNFYWLFHFWRKKKGEECLHLGIGVW